MRPKGHLSQAAKLLTTKLNKHLIAERKQGYAFVVRIMCPPALSLELGVNIASVHTPYGK